MNAKEQEQNEGRDLRGRQWLDGALGGGEAQLHGEPLPSRVRAEMEEALGEDFGQVRVHTQSEQAREHGARAYAEGQDVHFSAGEFAFDTPDGRELLLHELVHVAQNRLSERGEGQPATQGEREQEAQQVASGAASSRPRLQGAPDQPQFDLRADIEHVLGQRRDDRALVILIAVELASADEVRAVLADAPTMRRISRVMDQQQMALFRGAAARRLEAAGAHDEAFALLLHSNAGVQRRNFSAFGAQDRQRALQEQVIQTSAQLRLVRAAFSLYWGVRLDTASNTQDPDGSGPERARRVTSDWTVDRLRQLHSALRTLPEDDVRNGAFRRLTLHANDGGGSFQMHRDASDFGEFRIGTNASDRRTPVHFLSANAVHGQAVLQLDSASGLDAGHGVWIGQGPSAEQGTVASVDSAARSVTLQRNLLRDHAAGARVSSNVQDREIYRDRGPLLAHDTAPGATSLQVTELANFAQGDTIIIGQPNNEVAERRVIQALDATSRTITLQSALNLPHFQTDLVTLTRDNELPQQLTQPAAQGATSITVTVPRTLEPGTRFTLSPGTPDAEQLQVRARNMETGVLDLASPLQHNHPAATAIQRSAPAAGYRTSAAAHLGSRRLTLHDADNLHAASVLTLEEGTSRQEYVFVDSVEPNHRLRLHADLEYDHPANAPLTILRNFAPHMLQRAASSGDTTLRLMSVVNLHAGDTLLLELDTPREETLQLQAVDATQRSITLAAPLAHNHAERAPLAPRSRQASLGAAWLSAVVRHEIAHALDAALGPAATRGLKQDIAGWWEGRDFDAWTRQMGDPWRTNDGSTISHHDRQQIRARITARMNSTRAESLDHGLPANHPVRRFWEKEVPVIEACKMTIHGSDFWQHPSVIREYNGHCFAINHYYNHFQYYNADVQHHRVADYSSFSAAEFFAEVYTVFYEEAGQTPAPEPGRLLPVASWRDWMRTHIHDRGHTPAQATASGHTSPSIGIHAHNPGSIA